MTDSLLHAYLPLFFWAGIGVLMFRFVPESFPRLLGRSLYWVGIPVEIFALARQTRWSLEVGLAPLLTVCAILIGLVLAWTTLRVLLRVAAAIAVEEPSPAEGPLAAEVIPAEVIPAKITAPDGSPSGLTRPWIYPLIDRFTRLQPSWQNRAHQGSFILSATIGNTGFVGLAVAPTFVSEPYLGWLVLYSVTQNVVGTYGIGVFLASYFGRASEAWEKNHWWVQVRDVVTVPSLWAFLAGSGSQSIALPELMETGLSHSVWVIIPAALLLMGMRLSQLRGWQSLQMGVIPSLLKTILVPGLVGLLAARFRVTTDAQLAMVLMAGMPTAFAGLILAEEYNLDRELIASSIVLTSGLLLITIPLWLVVFGPAG
jgi:malate permease and related proteins